MQLRQWEHTHIGAPTNMNRVALEAANRLGAEGWEVVGVASADKTLGLNENLLILKREIVPPPAPEDESPEWHPDPCGRFDKRYWDGRVWTAHVATAATKKTSIDPPTLLRPPSADQP